MASSDIFGYSRTTAKPATVFDSSKSILTVQGGSPEGYLVQTWNLSYQQDVSEIFELGSDAVYWVRGRPTGTGSINRMMGVRGGITGLFPENAFNACSGGVAMTMTAGGHSCDGRTGQVFRIGIDGVVVNSVGFTMNAPSQSGISGLLNEDISFRFSFLQVA